VKLLFDTHTFMWWFNERKKLSARVLGLCTDRNNTLMLSVVTAWEMQIKLQLGKYTLSKSLREIIADEQKANQVQLLPGGTRSRACA
jgi:PIN domain nuclease of toxin-antitoxin system